jgi:hypothetical protein
LRRDAPALQAALGHGGVPFDSRHLTMTLSPTASASALSQGGAGGSNAAGAGAGTFGSDARAPSQDANQQARVAARLATNTADPPVTVAVTTPTAARRGRVGIDITA